MTGASGSFYSSGSNYNTGEVRLIVNWTQTFTLGNDYSTVTISAKLQRQNTETYTCGGTWYAWSTGGVKVGSTRAVTWYEQSTTAALTSPWDVGWKATGSVKVSHTAATTVTISIDQIQWKNTTYSNSSVTIPAKSVTVTLQAVPQGLIYIDNGSGWEAYQAYIDNGESWEMYAPYVDDGSDWSLMS